MTRAALTLAIFLVSQGAGLGQPSSEPLRAKAETRAPSAVLGEAVQAYLAAPSDVTWAECARALSAFFSDPAIARAEPGLLSRSNQSLSALGARCLESGPLKVWAMEKATHAQSVLVVLADARHPANTRTEPAGAAKVEALPLPPAVSLRDIRLFDFRPPAPAPKRAAPAKAKAAEADSGRKAVSGRYVVLAGRDRASGLVYLKSYRLEKTGWKESSEPLSAIPPFLLVNLPSSAYFAGPDLILVLNPQGLKPASAPAQSVPQNGESGSHKLCLRLVDGRYMLEGKAAEDTPYNAASQFVQAVLAGRSELAKGWLMDPRLASIPRYLGLATRTNAAGPRIIGMAGPGQGVHRFRLVTFDRDDLIIDVARSKTLWAIKALFVAPADPLIQKVARSLPAPEKSEEGARAPVSAPAAKTGGPLKN